MSTESQIETRLTRRFLLAQTAGCLGAAALAQLSGGSAAARGPQTSLHAGLPELPHFAPTAKRVIYLFQSGGPSHLELYDFKPKLNALFGTDLPDSVRQGQRLTEMTHKQSSFPVAPSQLQFHRRGESGAWISESLPHIGSVADEIAIIRSTHTEAINHDPAITYINTGSQQLGKPSLGSWLSYGLGSENRDLPAYIVLISQGTGRPGGQPLFSRLWSSGFLPSNHQGVRFRTGSDPVLFLNNPDGVGLDGRRSMLTGLNRLNRLKWGIAGDPEIETRISQYEMAFRMQTSVPDLVDLRDESAETIKGYGESATKPGTFAANCILARRMAERGVRFIQLFHRGWDQHGGLPTAIRGQCRDVDQASAALIRDLKQRGMLEETLVIWGGEFGRTVYAQGTLKKDNYGRDHHGRCFSVWMAGGGIKGGVQLGKTDDFGYNIVEDPVHIRDLNATILHCLGIDHGKLTYPYQGLAQKLTGVEPAQVLRKILA
ncbi:MAG: sulfatase [Planctomycetaceae bacterium]|nr:sulfatase [Planctomycetaceae bacterium]